MYLNVAVFGRFESCHGRSTVVELCDHIEPLSENQRIDSFNRYGIHVLHVHNKPHSE